MRIGIDLGGTNIAGGLVTDDGKLVFKKSIPTRKDSEAQLLSDIVSHIKDIANNAKGETITSVGIGVPGHADDSAGLVVCCNNVPLNMTSLAAYVKNETGYECHLGNDADAAALAEVRIGCAKDFNTAVMVTLGTGVGAGIIINNKLFTGSNGAAGELGHICIDPKGPSCNCGRRGCFELYASATALIRQTREAMKTNPKSLMWELSGNLSDVSGRTAFDAMKKGDETGKKVVDQFIKYLSIGILDILNFLQPEAIIIGGGISKEGDALLNPLREIALKECYSTYGREPQFLIAELGNDAGIIGAAFFGD